MSRRVDGTARVWTPWRVVLMFGGVSLAADMVYEGARSMYGPLLAALGASALVVGVVTGAGEAMALVLRFVFGPLADRTGRYWALTIAGYGLTTVCVPLLAVTPFLGGAGLAVGIVLILLERSGKAVRSPSKSALLAHVAAGVGRGRGFGVHKAMDQVGAFAGPLLVAAVLAVSGAIWPAFLVLAVPGAAAMVLLAVLRARVPDPSVYDGSSPRAADASAADTAAGPVDGTDPAPTTPGDDADPAPTTAATLGPGDIAILRGPDAYTIGDDPRTAPQAVIHPGQRCTTVDGAELLGISSLGVRTWGNDPAGSTVMLTGTYQLAHEVGRRLLTALQPLAILRRADRDEPLVDLVAREIAADRPGQEVVLDRLLDLLLVAGLRKWFDRQADAAPGWYRSAGDPVVGRAVRLMENNLAHPWTVASLAAAVGISRAALARRFTELVGQPPMTFLTQARLELAADLLLEPGSTLGAVARQTGYASPFALSSAFRRVRGETPQQHRARRRRQVEVGDLSDAAR